MVGLLFLFFTVSVEIRAEKLKEAIGLAKDGDKIVVNAGIFKGQIEITKKLELIGKSFPVIDGEGKGTVLRIEAPVKISGFIIRNSGDKLGDEDSGILVEGVSDFVIENNIIEDVLFGVYLKSCKNGVVRNNRILGKKLDLSMRGDGIRLWNTRDILIEGNYIENTRDAVIWFSERITFTKNKVKNSRYGLHYMYSNGNILSENEFYNNIVGTFVMYSKNIIIEKSIFGGSKKISGMGVGFKDASHIVMRNNVVADNTVGIYLANSPEYVTEERKNPQEVKEKDIIEKKVYGNFIGNNVFAFNTVAIRILPPSFPNYIINNTFWGNMILCEFEQVLEDKNVWYSNYYDQYKGFDLDQDGFGDIPFKYETLFVKLLLDYPEIRFLYFSPLRSLIEYVSHVLPFLKPEPIFSDPKPKIKPDFYVIGRKNNVGEENSRN